jgi:hypothetical protein
MTTSVNYYQNYFNPIFDPLNQSYTHNEINIKMLLQLKLNANPSAQFSKRIKAKLSVHFTSPANINAFEKHYETIRQPLPSG